MYVDKSWEVIHIIGATNNIIITATCTRGRCSYRLSHSHKIGGGGGVLGGCIKGLVMVDPLTRFSRKSTGD